MRVQAQNYRLAVSCVALLALAGLATSQDEPKTRRLTAPGVEGAQVQINQIETSQFPKVVIFATVLKDNAPVPGLTDTDFRVREDEVDQEPLTVVPQLTPLSTVLTLDTSGSMKKRLADAQTAAKSFLKTLQAQDKVQVMRFSRDVKTLYPLGADRARAEAAIDSTVARGDTALWDALHASVESLRDVAGRKAIVLLSDGVDDDGTGKSLSKRTVTDVLALARQVNVPIYTIGLGTELDELALKQVASETGALYLNAVEASELKRLYDSIGKQLAGQYTISYTSDLPADGSEHSVQLRVGDSRSTKSYLPATTTATQPTPQRVAAPAAAAAPDKDAPVEQVKRITRAVRTVKVVKPTINMPALKQILVVTAGVGDNPHAYLPPDTAGSATKYDEAIRIAPDAKAEKFDVYWIPKQGKRLALVKGIAFDQEHSAYELKPEDHLGLVRLGGKDLPKPTAIYLAEAGANRQHVRLFAIQKADKYGEDMPVPAGTYDLYIDVADENRLELVSAQLAVKAGKVIEVE